MGVRRSLTRATIASFAVCAWLVAGTGGQALAAPPADAILPTNTVVYVGFPDFPKVNEKWPKTQVGRFLDDPAMGEFFNHFKERLRERIAGGAAGLTIEEAADLPSGPAAFAISRDDKGKSIEWALVDVSGADRAKIDDVLGKLKARVAKAGGKDRPVKAGATTLTVHDVPADPKAQPGAPAASPRKVAHFEREGLLVICTHEGAAVDAATRWNAKPKEALAGSATYQAIFKRLEQDAQAAPGQGVADVNVFIRPMAYAETMRADFPRKAPPGEPDLLEVLRNQQFHQIYGVGGTGHFDQGKYDVIVRTAAYAPTINQAKNALRLLSFINAAPRPAQEWLPAGVGTFIDAGWDVDVAFDGFGSFFDEYMEEKGAWQDLIDSVREDPNGPGIDLKRDLIGLAGDRVSIVSRFVLPPGVDSRQKLIIVETSDEAKLAKNIAASLKGDPKVKSRDFEGIQLHEIHDQQPPPAPGAGQKAVKIPPTAIAVAHGALLISTHVDLMETVLKKANADGAAVKAYDAVLKELAPMFPPPYGAAGWFDAAQNVEPSFELMRAGKLDDDHSLIGEILRRLAEDGKRNLKLDGSKLPEFGKVKHYFTSGGFGAKVEPNFGWFGKGYVLKDGQGEGAAPATNEGAAENAPAAPPASGQ